MNGDDDDDVDGNIYFPAKAEKVESPKKEDAPKGGKVTSMSNCFEYIFYVVLFLICINCISFLSL